MQKTEVSANPTPLTESERNAMRGYLQRSEVRLSTLHRIATAFIGGAGLLLLIPVFFKDVVDSIIQTLLDQPLSQFTELGVTGNMLVTAALFLLILYPLGLSLAIPLYGVYLLVKDIVHFYFTIYMPGFSDKLLNPTFAITGLTLPVDEAPNIKHDVMRYQYTAHNADYMLPFNEERRELYFDKLIENTNGDIIPPSRRFERLKMLDDLPPNFDPLEVQRINAAFGIARSLDRTLVEEVAVAEMALVRHVMYLRRLVLRYVKTLLMFIWTTGVSFLMLPFLRDGRFPVFIVLAVGYLIWSLAVMSIMHFPLRWIYRHHGNLPKNQIDTQLSMFEDGIEKFSYMAILAAVIALILAVFAYY